MAPIDPVLAENRPSFPLFQEGPIEENKCNVRSKGRGGWIWIVSRKQQRFDRQDPDGGFDMDLDTTPVMVDTASNPDVRDDAKRRFTQSSKRLERSR
jgi:hypothetical protein